MAAALEKLQKENLSGRLIAAQMGYRSSVALSHMSTGRVPIPVDRAVEFAKKLKIDPATFVLAVLEQRYPDIDFMRLLVGDKKALAVDTSIEDVVADDIRSAAGSALAEMPEATLAVLKEAASDRNPRRRWMSMSELTVMDILRKERPDMLEHSLTSAQRAKLAKAVADL